MRTSWVFKVTTDTRVTFLYALFSFFLLNSAEREIYPADNCWHFNIYQQDKYNIWETQSKKLTYLSVS